jgi:hypothetical protein
VIWSLFQAPVTVLVLGLVLALVGILLLREYAKVFRHDPRTTMSVEVFFALITQTGAPGYLAAFLISGAVLCAASAVLMLLLNVSSYLGAHGVG